MIHYIFEGQPRPLSAGLLGWMDASPRFTAFVETYRDKIRKKLRVAGDPESRLDVIGELEVAYRLLNDRRLSVTYEPYASAKRRGPDFAVTYRANQVFNIEVSRMHAEGDLPQMEERVLRILLAKLGQMQPNMANLLVIHTRPELAQVIDLPRLLQALKARADQKDPAFYALSRYAGPAAFYKDFLRLSGILLWAEMPQLWVNKPARPVLDEKILRLVSSLAGKS